MVHTNIRILRKRHKMSQEVLAEKVGVSRQTIAKWENGEAVPDIHQCKVISDLFEVTLEQLSENLSEEDAKQMGPKGKQFFGVVKVGEQGQVILPKEAREMYQIQTGDKLVVLGEDATKGLAILKTEGFLELAKMIRKAGEDAE